MILRDYQSCIDRLLGYSIRWNNVFLGVPHGRRKEYLSWPKSDLK